MKRMKLFAALAAIMMISFAGIVAVNTSSDSDAFQGASCNCSKMTTTFHVYADSGYIIPAGASEMVGEGSNAYLALIDAMATYNATNGTTYIVSASDKPYVQTGSYYMMNENYGDVTGLFGLSDSGNASWKEFYWNGTAWTSCSKGLGYYKSVSDVPDEYKTSNIALFYTSGNDGPISSGLTNVIKTVDSCKEFDVSIYITGAGVTNPGWITGSGSDCFKAFYNAANNAGMLSSAYNFNTTYDNQYYGYVDEFIGLDEIYDEDEDVYYSWSLFVWDGTQWVSAFFTPGHYTPGTDTYVDANNNALTLQTQYMILSYGAWTSTAPAVSTPFPVHSCA